ncbi:MAG: hypothetical protein A3I77_00035 [Gammaproteobacteria bacterium RIFCSPLOWO2_02_FULL_42_14]|nr:MAG: hypothetical protein A3B71_00035 [Gammaproteobacteria bacterium RIFCSPHIGHO2_02_FULL_42_43]OGT27238.1 MAG: hypothetical protein A2624_02720 [Gammaproteobacteria bacterium RIFCSPHIGHO2_01_FULL_42_8]OGT51884.1 MAG: hypothetical protein A3E54_01060 [Gammaproteobacteria bacterium RIFCSPHIGHO2_12_FULL_41_25]OGT62398.1 MAG: hypothetical protein A3I77_00035 [Gammaproteobacteria bacterium RIFCSPLOWO2_02_FULL_42_14]OGT85350.1 MAG: hypothetical protein A3G86_07985 [Gammaproteobacteria bacterium R
MKTYKIIFLGLIAAMSTAMLSGCGSSVNYVQPNQVMSQSTTIQGNEIRHGMLSANWTYTYVRSIDNRPISYSFFTGMSAGYKIRVTPNMPHKFTILSQFNQSMTDGGPYEGFGDITATLKPGQNYVVRSKSNGAKINMWIENMSGKKISQILSVPYNAMPQDETIIVNN